jgi:hypothetical protein
MARTRVTSRDIRDGQVSVDDLNTDIPGKAVITKIIPGSNVTIASTGVDAGTGEVTINAQGGSSSFSFKEILNTETILIPERQQMIVHRNITIDGILDVDGELVVIN